MRCSSVSTSGPRRRPHRPCRWGQAFQDSTQIRARNKGQHPFTGSCGPTGRRSARRPRPRRRRCPHRPCRCGAPDHASGIPRLDTNRSKKQRAAYRLLRPDWEALRTPLVSVEERPPPPSALPLPLASFIPRLDTNRSKKQRAAYRLLRPDWEALRAPLVRVASPPAQPSAPPLPLARTMISRARRTPDFKH